MNTSKLRALLLTGATVALVAGIAPLQAQIAAQTAAETAGESDIIVTAQKRSERLQEVPASVAVVTVTDLTKQGAVKFQDYANQIPGLSLTSARTGNTQIVLRGISTGASQPGSTTGFYVDEAPVGSVNAYTGGNGITPDLDPSDLQQVEVLKGPQGTLYGAGAVGGLLKFTTARPSLSEYQGSAAAGVNSVDHGGVGYSFRGMVNIPLETDQLAIHGSAFYRHDAGYVDNVNPLIGKNNVNDARIRGGRAVISAKLGPDVRMDVSAILQDTTTNGTNTIDVDANTLQPIYGDYRQNRFVREQGFERLRLYNATFHADLGRVNLVSSTTYQRIYYREIGDATRSYAAFLTANAPVLAFFGHIAIPANLGMRVNTIKHTDRWSQEARASIDDLGGILDLQGGFYWTHESDTNRIPNIDYFSTATGTPFTLPPFAIASINSTYEEFSGFGNARLHLGSKFDILGGVRVSHDNQNYVQDYRGLLISISTGAIARGATTATLAANGNEKATIATWMVSPRYRITDDVMVYGRAATGYRPGGPNPAPPTGGIPLTFEPDRLTQYEVGLKTAMLDRKLTIDAALFYTDWKNIQIQTSAGGFNYLVNGGKARSKGGEVTVRYEPVRGLVFGANANYTDAKLATPAPAAGGLKGDRLPYIPHWAGSLTGDYSVPVAGSTKATVGASLNYTGERISDYTGIKGTAPDFPKRLGSYTTVDLRAGLDFGKLTISAFAKNLTDKRAIIVTGFEGLAASNTPGVFYSGAIIQPRTIGAEAAIRF